jgi:putative MFS transporter
VTALSAGGLFLDGFDLTVIAVAVPVLRKEWHLSGAMLGLVSSSALIGMLVGALALGWLTDRIGRKRVYTIDLVCFVVFAALTAVAQNAWELVLLRFLLGIAVGADYPISSALTAEFASSSGRGRHIAYMSAAYSVGAVCAYLMGLVFGGFGEGSWRWMLLMGAGFAVVVAIARTTIPESPRWLSAQGRGAEASRIVAGLLGREDSPSVAPAASGPRRRPEVLSREFLGRTLFVCVFYFCFAVTFYGVQLYTPTIVAGMTGSSPAASDVGSAAVSCVGLVAMVAVGSLVVERWGRRPAVLLGFFGQAVFLALLALSANVPFAVVVLLFAAAMFCSNSGPGFMVLLYPSELFPTTLRASGVGLAVGASRIGAILGVFVFPSLIEAWGLHRALWGFVLVAAIVLAVCLAFAPETKGRVLEDITEPETLSAEPAGGARG